VSEQTTIEAGGYRLPTDRGYDAETHLWVRHESPGRVRCGFDPLGADTSGDLVALSFEPVGALVTRGAAFGNLEAAKFVGPLISPVAGRIVTHNTELLANPGLVNDDPTRQWMIEIELDTDIDAAVAPLLREPAEIREWIEREVRRFKERGMIAE
jgi:glycine cleavage system H protein